MRYLNNILLLIFLLVAFVDCNENKYEMEKPNDFSFRFIDETDSYDSKTGIYTRKYILKDSSIKFVLAEADLLKVYNAFKKYDFMSFPNKFTCSKFGTFTMPAFSTTIEVTYNGTNKKVTNTDYCSRKVEQRKSKKFDEFSSIIWEIISNKPQVKNMKECDLGFM